MAKLSNTELLDAFKEMTLIELSEFLKQFEETFDVTAAVSPLTKAIAVGPDSSASSSSTPRSRTAKRTSVFL